MKTLRKLKLTKLGESDLESRQMNALRGGGTCGCVCVACICSSYNPDEDKMDSVDNGQTDVVSASTASSKYGSTGGGYGGFCLIAFSGW